MRVLAVALCAVLAGCAVEDVSGPPAYVPPSPPSPAAQMKGLKQAIEAEKLAAPLQISDVRKVDNGPGSYMICIAGRRGGKDDTGYYATFFENDLYKDVRPAVMYDFCEKQSYRPMN